MHRQGLYFTISLVFNFKKNLHFCHFSRSFLNFIVFIRVKFARNLAFFMSQKGRCLEYWVFWMTDAGGGKHNTGLMPKLTFSFVLFGKHDSSWKDNCKLRIELSLLILFNFDFMAYYVAQSVGLPNKLSSKSLLSKLRVFLVIQISMFPFLLTIFLILSLIYRINCNVF